MGPFPRGRSLGLGRSPRLLLFGRAVTSFSRICFLGHLESMLECSLVSLRRRGGNCKDIGLIFRARGHGYG